MTSESCIMEKKVTHKVNRETYQTWSILFSNTITKRKKVSSKVIHVEPLTDNISNTLPVYNTGLNYIISKSKYVIDLGLIYSGVITLNRLKLLFHSV